MTVVLTICSVNYLAHARTLGEMLLRHNPGYRLVIGLVDRIPESMKESFWAPHELIPVEELDIPEFEAMRARYNLVELNTAVKPFYMEHLYRRNPEVRRVMYLDPDILVLSNFKPIEESLLRYNLVLTPHHCSYDENDETYGYEINMLETGICNLGFIATRRSEETMRFLAWWQKRLVKYCYYRPGATFFVDQKWTDLVPLYFEGVLVEKNLGYNVCYWNLTERHVTFVDGRYRVNDRDDLLFYHFSAFVPEQLDRVTKRTEVELIDSPCLLDLRKKYAAMLERNGYQEVRSRPCWFYPVSGQAPPAPPPPVTCLGKVKKGLKAATGASIRVLPGRVRELLRRAGQYVADTAAT